MSFLDQKSDLWLAVPIIFFGIMTTYRSSDPGRNLDGFNIWCFDLILIETVLMRTGVAALLLTFLIVLTSSAQEPVSPVVKEHTDEPILADDPRSIQAHAGNQSLVFRMTERWNAHDLEGFMEIEGFPARG